MNTTPARITLANLDRTVGSFDPKIRQDPDWTKWTLATSIIGRFLGKEWVKENIPHRDGASSTGFFQMDFSSTERRDVKTARMLDFAETLFNLQHIGGFDHRAEQMRSGDPESGLAEFDFGRFLYIHDVDFRYVIPTGKRGHDYDCAITYRDGRVACADAKCRVENSEMRPDAIYHALTTARRKNLPPDQPGIVFVKVPQSWLESEEERHGLVNVAQDFLRQTERVVLVALYVNVYFFHKQQQLMVFRHLVDEVENPKHRFDQTKSWRLFKGFSVPPEWNGMPPKWQRIFSRGSDDPAYKTQTTSAA
jgi:hypothetical protein